MDENFPPADDLRLPDHVEVLNLLQLADNCLSRSKQIMKRNGATEATLIDLLANTLFTIRANYEKKVTCQYFPFAARIVKRRYLYHYRHTPLNPLLSSLWEEIIKLRPKEG